MKEWVIYGWSWRYKGAFVEFGGVFTKWKPRFNEGKGIYSWSLIKKGVFVEFRGYS